MPEVPCLVMSVEAGEDVSSTVTEAMAHAFKGDLLRLESTSYLGILAGRRAQLAAAVVLVWIECIWNGEQRSNAFTTL